MTDDLAGVAGVPSGSLSVAQPAGKKAVADGEAAVGGDGGAGDADADLQERLNNLRRE